MHNFILVCFASHPCIRSVIPLTNDSTLNAIIPFLELIAVHRMYCRLGLDVDSICEHCRIYTHGYVALSCKKNPQIKPVIDFDNVYDFFSRY